MTSILLYSLCVAPGPVSNLAGTPKFTSIVLTWSPPQEPNGVITYTVNDNNTVRLEHYIHYPPQTRVSAITVTAYTRIGQGELANLPDQTTLELRELLPLHASYYNHCCHLQL